MATVTGLTAARMLSIEANSVVDGDIVGNDLILTKHSGATINAGNVRGPQGPTGPTGEVSTAALDAAILAALPVGVILDYIETSAPAKWLAMTGQTIPNGQTDYPNLWAKLPASMKSGSNIVFPDTRGRVVVNHNSADADFDTIGEVGGSKTHTLTQAELPNATITINPPSTSVAIDPPSTTSSSAGSHSHTYNVQNGDVIITEASSGVTTIAASGDTTTATTGSAGSHSHTVDIPSFNVAVDIPAFQSGALGSGQAHNNMQPYVVFLKIIKAL